MKIFDKFPKTGNLYRESTLDRSKRNLQLEINNKEINKKEKLPIDNSNLTELNAATLYFSRNQSKEKVNGVEEAFKLLNEMTIYLESQSSDHQWKRSTDTSLKSI